MVVLSFLRALFETMGVVLGICDLLVITNQCKTLPISLVVIAIIVLSIAWFFIDGFFVTGFLINRLELKNGTNGTKIKIRFGDIFGCSGMSVVSVNEFFDGLVQGTIVSPCSIHGQMLNKYWPNDAKGFEGSVRESLTSQQIKGEVVAYRKGGGCLDRFPIGSVAVAKGGVDVKFLCVALSNTDVETNEAHGDMNNVLVSIRSVINYARAFGNGANLNFTVIGSGLSKTGLSKSFLLNLLIQTIFDETSKNPLSSPIQIILYSRDKSEYNLKSIRDSWI